MIRNSTSESRVRHRVAFQGERGAYSEEAVLRYFGDSVSLRPCRTLNEVFSVVSRREAGYGLVPVENSMEGSVNLTYDLLLDTNLKVIGEVSSRIVHCLVGMKESKLERIITVYSHPQALGQCSTFLEKLGCVQISEYDTAGSVKMIKERNDPSLAAIASKRAAEFYGMAVLAEGIEDNPGNYTRFLALRELEPEQTGDDKTLIAVNSDTNDLGWVLTCFKNRDIPLQRIEVRPTKKRPWNYVFYLEFQGNSADEEFSDVVQQIRDAGVWVKVLGSYPREMVLPPMGK